MMMKKKTKICKECGKETYIWSKGKCKSCAAKDYKKINSVSEKRKKSNKIYSEERLKYLESHIFCKAKLENCTVRATDIHHMKGRLGELFLDTRYWLAVCRKCHTWITENPLKAIALGLSKSRY